MSAALSDDVADNLATTVQKWADENLVGKPSVLATCMYFALEKEMLRQEAEIKKTFPEGEAT